MRQVIATKVSNAILDWRDAETVSLLEFKFPIKPGGQYDKNHRKLPEVKAFMDNVEQVAREQIANRAEDTTLGARLVIVQMKRSGDLTDNIAKPIFDALKQIAFGDDLVFDYLEKVRVRAEEKNDVGFSVEILRLTPRRDMWLAQ